MNRRTDTRAPAKPAAAGPARSPRPGAPRTAAHEVRIIGGQWKRSKLGVADKPGLRPTPDRVRETLFNWLTSAGGDDWSRWQVIDAFAGTGALGFEAASRGAGRVTLVEQDAALVAMLHASRARLQAESVTVVRGDGRAVLERWPAASAQLILLDPPFDADWYEAALRAARQALAPGGWLYVEAPQAWSDEALAPLDLTLFRHLKAGAVHAHLLQRLAPGAG
ncbi:MAG: Ribosomal RNA small subunit methyltransferase D [Paracidovorax wautersii]|uniref:Ribosomal RNA small subunit methyltransferase D n=1 Tax=Paracidovorax wautersii TaxID=1177982 RepID=A0A7V8FKP8_9BURK|nr:MAG: Ribosomal RNA small subunit methyltransferase D [Paracidovorax wautersii]